MPQLPRDQVRQYISAWKKARPSQINDSFSKHKNGLIERILAFEFNETDFRQLIPGTPEAVNDPDPPKLILFYGLTPVGQKGEGSLNVFVNTVKGNVIQNEAFLQLTPLTYSDFQEKFEGKSILQKGNNNAPVTTDPQHVTSELIPNELEYMLSYAWKTCDTSRLVDQTEGMVNGQRMRIERSIYDGQVYQLMNGLYNQYESGVETLLFLGLHEVIPNDSRIYPFGPILKSYTPGTQITLEDGDQDPKNLAGDNDTLSPEDFELSKPCPPSCEPPDV